MCLRDAFLAALIFFSPVHSVFAQEWSAQDKALFTAGTALLVVDWGQTRDIAKHPQQFHEKNLILGEHPSMGRVNAYFSSVIVANYFITDALSRKWRTAYQAGLIGVELAVIGNNKRLGIKVNF